MHDPYAPSTIIKSVFHSLGKHKEAYEFIRTHKIWAGLMEYGWAVRAILFSAIFFSFTMVYSYFNQFFDFLQQLNEPESEFGTTDLISGFFEMNKTIFLGSGMKYVLLILLEIFIFHCSIRTINILRGQNEKPTFKDFLHAEKRMLLVAGLSFIFEIVIIFVISLVLTIFGLSFINPLVKFVLAAYFIGFSFMDNYNEQFGVSIKASSKIIRQYSGIAIGVGIVTNLLFLVPLVGVILAPILGAVTSAIIMNELNISAGVDRQFEGAGAA